MLIIILLIIMKRFTATHGIKAKKGEQKLFLWVGKLNLVEKIADDDA